MVQDMLAGRVQYGGDQLSSSLGHVRGGNLKPLAVANPTRSQALPDVPTVRELGFPNLEYRGFNGFFAPKGTPDAIVARLQQEIAAAAKQPDLIKRMTDVGAEPSGSSQAEMRDLLREQIGKLKPLIEELKLVVQ
jgi:tripartite-type tricarboxylate transporter receptor subunit TctC